MPLPLQSNDVSLKGIFGFLAILVAMLVVVYFLMTAMWRHLERNAQWADERAQMTPFAADPTKPYFPFPREQPNPLVDLKAVQARQKMETTTYGWVDKSNQIVRIPISRAMELMLEDPERKP